MHPTRGEPWGARTVFRSDMPCSEWGRIVRDRLGRKRERGQALVEMALIAPIFLLLVLGLIDFAGAFHAKITITNAAREGARLAGRGNIFSTAQVAPGGGRAVARRGYRRQRHRLPDDRAEHDQRVHDLYRHAGQQRGTSRLTFADLDALQQALTASEPRLFAR